ncbi:hypothetical protein VAE151_630256 [Vibrio aestuarianus]|uniref:Uncharacterized protein n=1 Tax=Vibrio aestuarianus TaxID=28171 RepID=A0ABN8TJ74_9VIBR|nr:hypothetical protein VAE063_1000256 [Vibrio aestuarianus]CAH8222904.1 hypothetical protein VAE130_600259 [Vibrio aestuarianus]CAH8234096.1 hypothetical protein VAE151_630256 [Vibrio aestuarianus]
MVLYQWIKKGEDSAPLFSNLSSYRSQCRFRDIYNYIDLPHYIPNHILRRDSHGISSSALHGPYLGW